MKTVTFRIFKEDKRVKIESSEGLKYQYPNMMSIETALAAVVFQSIERVMTIKNIYADFYYLEFTLKELKID